MLLNRQTSNTQNFPHSRRIKFEDKFVWLSVPFAGETRLVMCATHRGWVNAISHSLALIKVNDALRQMRSYLFVHRIRDPKWHSNEASVFIILAEHIHKHDLMALLLSQWELCGLNYAVRCNHHGTIRICLTPKMIKKQIRYVNSHA